MRLELSPSVATDLEAIADWIAQDSPRRAATVIQQLYAAVREIAASPLHYQLRPDIGESARLAVVGRYVILFRIVPEAVRIERILYGSRDLPQLFQ